LRLDERPKRDPQTTSLLARFSCEGKDVPEDARPLALACHDLAVSAVDRLPDGPELTAALWLLLGVRDFMLQATRPPDERRFEATVLPLRRQR
jgi:hypothetical protein